MPMRQWLVSYRALNCATSAAHSPSYLAPAPMFISGFQVFLLATPNTASRLNYDSDCKLGLGIYETSQTSIAAFSTSRPEKVLVRTG